MTHWFWAGYFPHEELYPERCEVVRLSYSGRNWA